MREEVPGPREPRESQEQENKGTVYRNITKVTSCHP